MDYHQSSNAIFELLEDLGADLEAVTNRNHVISPIEKLLAALYFTASGFKPLFFFYDHSALQTLHGDSQ